MSERMSESEGGTTVGLADWMGWEDGRVGLEVGLAMRLVKYVKINV
jgi:hypothetical protein